MRVTETETESELKTVEQTTTVEKIKCDVCGHEFPEGEWDGKEFSVDPGIDREAHSISDLDGLFDSYHREIETHVIDDGYNGYEMTFDVPKKSFVEVLSEESNLAMDQVERSQKQQLAIEGEKRSYADMIGTDNFYLIDGSIHHFMYRLNIEASTEDHKHVCTGCYEVIFD